MFRSKLKMTAALLVALAIGSSAVACASNEEEETTISDNWEAIESVAAEVEATDESEASETEAEETEETTAADSEDSVVWDLEVEGDDSTEIFKAIVSDIPAFLSTVSYFEDDYISCGYYYFDYNHDGIVEPIICAQYENENGFVVNRLCYLYYDSENGVVAIQANVLDSQGTTILYCDYDTYFTRVSFHEDRSQPETWVYYVDFYEDGRFSYIMADEFMAGEFFTDPTEYGMTVLPCYESGDLTPFEA